ncbi:DUF4956 domain-containing protein [Propionibacteriaceae bacterium Y1923]
MNTVLIIGIDVVAIAILTLGLYYRRHRRRELVTAFSVVNIGVLAVTLVLAGVEIGMGVGLGLFGVLSIIRLRSSEISHTEIAYYFASLAVGLIAGLTTANPGLAAGLIAMVVLTVALADSRHLLSRSTRQVLLLDRAYTDEQQLRARLEQQFGGQVQSVAVLKCDLVDDTTLVEVLWQHRDTAQAAHPELVTR